MKIGRWKLAASLLLVILLIGIMGWDFLPKGTAMMDEPMIVLNMSIENPVTPENMTGTEETPSDRTESGPENQAPSEAPSEPLFFGFFGFFGAGGGGGAGGGIAAGGAGGSAGGGPVSPGEASPGTEQGSDQITEEGNEGASGDGAEGANEAGGDDDEEDDASLPVPEFPSIVIPLLAVSGLMVVILGIRKTY